MTYPFFTVGHSTRTLDEFVELLQGAEVTLVADVRTVPRSHTNSQYNRDMLPQRLAEFDMQYEHLAALGGLRGRQRDVAPGVNAFWTNDSFHNYADYAMSELPRRSCPSAGAWPFATLCHHVRRSGVVALSSADYLRLPHRRRRYRLSYSWAETHRSGAHDRSGKLQLSGSLTYSA